MATKRGGGGSNGHGAGGKSSAKGGIGSASRGGDSSSAVGSGTRVQIDKNKVCYLLKYRGIYMAYLNFTPSGATSYWCDSVSPKYGYCIITFNS